VSAVRAAILVLALPALLLALLWVRVRGTGFVPGIILVGIAYLIPFGVKQAAEEPLNPAALFPVVFGWLIGPRRLVAWKIVRAAAWLTALTLTTAFVVAGLAEFASSEVAQHLVDNTGGLSGTYLIESALLWLTGLLATGVLTVGGAFTLGAKWLSQSHGPTMRTHWLVATAPRLRAISAGLLIGSFGLILCSMGCAAGFQQHVGDHLDAANGVIRPGKPTKRIDATLSDPVLLAAFSPVLVFHRGEHWPPFGVDEYLQYATATRVADGERTTPPLTVDRLDELTSRCDDTTQPCYTLSVDCPTAPPCAPKTVTAGGLHAVGTVYGRVVRAGDDSANNWSAAPSFHQKLTTILQWWIFYPYDDWSAPVILGFGSVEQRHAADWEAITMGLSAGGPLFVALSAHCGGTWDTWDSNRLYVNGAQDPRHDPLGHQLHPEVAVAKGSHAMYFDALDARAPDAPGCRDHALSEIAAVSAYAANIRDPTSPDTAFIPDVAPLDQTAKILRFPAFWSPLDVITTHLPPNPILDDPPPARSEGPKTPTLQDLYIDPISTIFCDNAWHRAQGSDERGNCPRPA
jgi:hypothetical protein